MSERRVLVVEDDGPLRSALVATLAADDVAVAEAASGEEALARFQVEGTDLVLLDLMLPGLDGMQVLERVRAGSDVPVIVLTVRDSKQDKLAALDAGADDYITKPFDSDELVARVRAALRRSLPRPADAPVVRIGDLTIDRGRHVVTRADVEINLTPTEWQLLELLLDRDGRLVRYETISAEITTRTGELDRQGTRMFIAQLRKKLGDDATDPRLILTHFGLGVRWIGALDERAPSS
jgi:two-component system KDP operon response regulator KdpE